MTHTTTCEACKINSPVGHTCDFPTQGEKDLEKTAMNIVYQLDDDAKLGVEFRQANNDKRIDFVMKLISSLLHQERQRFGRELLEKVKGMVINKLKPRNRYDENGKHINLDTIDYDQACDDILEELEKLPTLYNL